MSSASSATTKSSSFYNNQLPEIDVSTLVPMKTIGKGCFGRVVLSKADDELVAVKVINKETIESPNMMEKLAAELRVMKVISTMSPFLCACRGAYQTDDVLLIAMNYAGGGDLLFHLQLEGCFPEDRVQLITMQIVLGLQHMHSKGVLHRDLKLENILVTNDGRIQIADFGLSKFLPRVSNKTGSKMDFSVLSSIRFSSSTMSHDDLDAAQPSSRSSCFPMNPLMGVHRTFQTSSEASWGKTKSHCGTPAYRSPEMVQGLEYGLEADYWALGCIVYECLTGWSPFRGKTFVAINKSILLDQPRLKGLRRPITRRAKTFVTQLLHKDFSKRLGCGAGADRAIRNHPFFLQSRSSRKMAYTWQQVQALDCPSILLHFNNSGTVAAPQQAHFFPEEFLCMDVVEQVKHPEISINVNGFHRIPDAYVLDKFISILSPTCARQQSSTGLVEHNEAIQVVS